MGFGGISIWQLLIILVIIVLLFGTKRLRNIGTDLGSAIRGFRSSIKDGEAETPADTDATFPEARKEVTAAPTTTATTAAAAPAQPVTTEAPSAPAATNNTGTDKN